MGDPLERTNPCGRGPKRTISMICEGLGCYRVAKHIRGTEVKNRMTGRDMEQYNREVRAEQSSTRDDVFQP